MPRVRPGQRRALRHLGRHVGAGAPPPEEAGRLIGGVLVFQDVTERQEAAELIRYMANHDPLTNLPNRNYFRRRLPQAISLAKRYGRILCLLFIDLDRFKPINDQYGHGVGDMVLMQVAERLRGALRTSDSVCRLGGDEFVILLESSPTKISRLEWAAYIFSFLANLYATWLLNTVRPSLFIVAPPYSVSCAACKAPWPAP